MNRNIALYPYYALCWNLMFWLPVFFLYLSSVLALHEVLLLEAIYYLAVVVLEVPSGALSDRIGRRLTLMIGAGAWVAGSVLFFSTSSFMPFMAAQVLFATGMAFNSGTDTSLLYESLRALGRESEIAEHEARANTFAFSAGAISALVGGAIAGFDLRSAYALTAVAGLASIGLVFAFREPTRNDGPAGGVGDRLTTALRRATDPTLAWTMLFAVALIVLVHVPYEFAQPYLGQLFGSGDPDDYQITPTISGVLSASMMGLAALTSLRAVRIVQRLGLGATLLLAVGVELVIIVAMGATVHAAIIILLLMRTVPIALTQPAIRAVIHPRVDSSHRATYLSLQSLAGRLAFSTTLGVAAFATRGDRPRRPRLG